MDRDITRRDFLNGMNLAITGSLLSAPLSRSLAALESSGAQMMPGYFPPTLEGLRGSHPGSFEVAHLLRDGARYDDPADSADTGEEYDLVVVGGGISGLAAAHFFRKEAGPDARILILENHDDFGGHAKRNEFHIDGRMLLDLGYDHEDDRMSYWSSDDWSDDQKHWLKGRQRFGRIAIANSDAGAQAMTEAAIEQAHRATQELLNES